MSEGVKIMFGHVGSFMGIFFDNLETSMVSGYVLRFDFSETNHKILKEKFCDNKIHRSIHKRCQTNIIANGILSLKIISRTF